MAVAQGDLLERERELGMLAAAFTAVDADSGGALALVHGEAGVGKTALVRRFCGEHEATTRILWGACEPLFTPRPLGPFLDIAADAEDDRLSALLAAGALPYEVASELVRELAAGPAAILVVEDAHWADEATLDVLRLLSGRLGGVSAFVVVTYRDDELERTHPLRTVLGELATTREVVRVAVSPLSAPAVGLLAAGHSIDPEELYRRTSGNPFFVGEVLAAPATEIPGSVRDAVFARMARLDTRARDLLDAVAVASPRAELWLLEAVAGDSIATLGECLASGMLRLEDDAVVFRHELARLAVEASINPHRRLELHRSALGELRSPPVGGADLARLAHHAEAAGDAAAVLEFAPAAAEQAASLGAHREAAAQYFRALRFADSLDDAKRADLLHRHAYARYVIGEFYAGHRRRARSSRILPPGRRPLGRSGRAPVPLAPPSLCRPDRRGDEGRPRGRGDPRVTTAGTELALAYANLSHLHQHLEDREETIAWAERAIELGDPEAEAYALTNIASAEQLAGRSGARELERAFEIAHEAGLDEHAGRALIGSFWWSSRGRAYSDADRNLDRTLAFCNERGLELWRLFAYAFRSRLQLDRGDWSGGSRLGRRRPPRSPQRAGPPGPRALRGRPGSRAARRPRSLAAARRGVGTRRADRRAAASGTGSCGKGGGCVARSTDVPLVPQLDVQAVRQFVSDLDKRVSVPAEDAELTGLKGLRPQFKPEKPGVQVLRALTVQRIVRALESPQLHRVRVAARAVAPARTVANFGPVIVIRRGANQSRYYTGAKLVRTFGVSDRAGRVIRHRPAPSASSTCS